jgi:organic anion transporter 5A
MAVYRTDEPEEDESSAGCGLGSWRPKWLQAWATPKIFLLLFSIEGVLSGGSYMYMVASLTTLEKRYAFDSLVSGFILIADDVMGLISRPIFGYIANKVHRPRLIAWCMVLVGVGCFLATVPYLIYGPATHLLTASIATNKSIEFCDTTRDPNSSCDKNSESKSSVIPVIFLWSATALNGLGGAAFWGIGMPFIDDSVKKKKSPLFISKYKNV